MTAKEFKDKFWGGSQIKTRDVLYYVNHLETVIRELKAQLKEANENINK